MLIELISNDYNGNIKLYQPLKEEKYKFFPAALLNILKVSNGIMETMVYPGTGERLDVGWIVYPAEEILERSEFYQKKYLLDGTVFSSDGAGNPLYMKRDGKVYLLNVIGKEEVCIANSLYDLYCSSTNVSES